MAYSTIVIKKPQGMDKTEIKKKFKADSEYISKNNELSNLTQSLNHLKQAQHLSIFAGKITNDRRAVVFISDGNIEIHCELLNTFNKYQGLYMQGLKIYDDVKRILNTKIELVQITISDSSDELVYKVIPNSFGSRFKENFTSSWLDRFAVMTGAGFIACVVSDKVFLIFLYENITPMIFYILLFIIWPLFKTFIDYMCSSKKFKKELVGM